MVTGCGCHDWRVFGHGRRCSAGLGPRSHGGTVPSEDFGMSAYRAEHGQATPPERRVRPSRIAQARLDEWISRTRVHITFSRPRDM